MPAVSDNVKAKSFKAEFLENNKLPAGQDANQHKGKLGGWDKLQGAGMTSQAAWVKMHLLTEQLGGQATDSNLTPARGPQTNTKFYNQMEKYAAEAVRKKGKVIWYKVDIDYYTSPKEDYINNINATWGEYENTGNKWQEGPVSQQIFQQNPEPPDFNNAVVVDLNLDGRQNIEKILKVPQSFARHLVSERDKRSFDDMNDCATRMIAKKQTENYKENVKNLKKLHKDKKFKFG